MSLWESISGINLGDAGAAALNYAAYDEGKSSLDQFAQQAQQGTQAAWDQYSPNLQFKPFSVTTGTGATSGYNNGQLTMQGGAQETALQNQLFGGASNFYNQAMQQNPWMQQQANMFGGMAQNYGPSQFTRQNVSPYGYGNAGINALSNQTLGMGMQQLGQAGQAPADIQALRSQVAGQAGNLLGQVGMSQTDRESDVYNRIRAMQSPEEERQQMALEERLAAQGRLGVSTAQYGGTPEQLALNKARAEAQNSAALQAMQQAGSESDRAYQQATGMAGLTSSLAGQSSTLQSQMQQRATELANMGMSAQQINSQLQSEGLSRNIQAGGFANQQDQMAQQMRTADIQNMLALAGGSQGALSGMLGLQQGYGDLGSSMFTQAYLPQAQQLNAYQQALSGAQMEQQAMQQYGTSGMESYLTGLDAALQSQLGKSNLTQGYMSALADIMRPTINPVTGQPVDGSGLFGGLTIGSLFGG